MAKGGADRTLANAAIRATNAKLLSLLAKFGVPRITKSIFCNTFTKKACEWSFDGCVSMSRNSGVTRLGVSLPSPLVEEFDDVWQRMKYTDRSKAVHDALRGFISDHTWMQEETKQLMGVIVLLYYPDKPGLLKAIMDVQHEFENVISSTMHVHLTRDKCLEIIAVKGKAEDTKVLVQKLMTKKGVKELKFAAVAP